MCRRAVEVIENDVRKQTVLTTVSGRICSINKQGRGLFFTLDVCRRAVEVVENGFRRQNKQAGEGKRVILSHLCTAGFVQEEC